MDRKAAYESIGRNAAAADAKRQQLEIKSIVKAQAKEAGIEVLDARESSSLKAVFASHTV